MVSVSNRIRWEYSPGARAENAPQSISRSAPCNASRSAATIRAPAFAAREPPTTAAAARTAASRHIAPHRAAASAPRPWAEPSRTPSIARRARNGIESVAPTSKAARSADPAIRGASGRSSLASLAAAGRTPPPRVRSLAAISENLRWRLRERHDATDDQRRSRCEERKDQQGGGCGLEPRAMARTGGGCRIHVGAGASRRKYGRANGV